MGMGEQPRKEQRSDYVEERWRERGIEEKRAEGGGSVGGKGGGGGENKIYNIRIQQEAGLPLWKWLRDYVEAEIAKIQF